ncbi:MAG: hypothetical protein QOH26_1930 [Actinomycetota bacterium]|jgi:DNA-binding NarL/FixJ family response regulator|nr:hypothetical protein [Actinomycetota bacterium]
MPTVLICDDVVLLDIQMPVKDGLQALEEIRRDCPHTKVMMLSGLLASNLGETAHGLGAHDYIEKGASLIEIGARIKQLAAG